MFAQEREKMSKSKSRYVVLCAGELQEKYYNSISEAKKDIEENFNFESGDSIEIFELVNPVESGVYSCVSWSSK